MSKLLTFIEVYAQYRVANSRRYAARIAYDVAFKGMDF